MAIKETYDDKDLLNQDLKFSPLNEQSYKLGYYNTTQGPAPLPHLLLADVRNMIRASERKLALQLQT